MDIIDLNQIRVGKKGLAFAKTEQAVRCRRAQIAAEVRTDAPRFGDGV